MKLSEEQKSEIRQLFQDGTSKSKLAGLFQVSRRTIEFTLFPEKRKTNENQLRKKNGWKEIK